MSQSDTNAELQTQLIALISKQNSILEKQGQVLEEQRRMLEVLGKASMREVLADVDHTIQDRQYTMLETMEEIGNGKSIARWGDGEIRIMLQPEFDLSFQRPNPQLANALQDLLVSYDENFYHTLQAFPTMTSSRFWMGIWADSWHLLKPLMMNSTSKWANTHVTRPLFFQKHREEAVSAWRSLWDNKNVCLIAGKGSRFALLPELFDNVKDIKRIDSLPRDAFDEFDDLKRRIDDAPNADIYLTALGPTGTVLSAHISSPSGGNKHSIDIGHLASSYANVFLGGQLPENVPLVSN